MMMAFIEANARDLGIDAICGELALMGPSSAPSYHEDAARLADRGKRPARARRGDEIRARIGHVRDASFDPHGKRKALPPARAGAWHRLRRERIVIAKCALERLRAAMGDGRRAAERENHHHGQRYEGAIPAGQGRPRVPRKPAQCPVRGRLHLRPLLGRGSVLGAAPPATSCRQSAASTTVTAILS